MKRTPGFSGEPLTRWRGEREMILEEDLDALDLVIEEILGRVY